MPNWLEVGSPGGLPLDVNADGIFLVDGGRTIWRRLDFRSKVYLEPKGKNPLPFARRYEIIRQGNDFILRPAL
jgi:hypothetical protein